MYLDSIASAVPDAAYSQPDCWQLLKNSNAFTRLRRRSQGLLEKVLLGDSGIDKRHFACRPKDSLFQLDATGLNRRFEAEAPRLAGSALETALQKADIEANSLDALFLCTCTGYLCPGPSSHVAEQLGLRADCFLQDCVGLGCGAAIPTLRAVEGFLSANPSATVACVAVEICSAAFYLDDDPGVLISACLFGDGASATIWSGRAGSGRFRLRSFDTLHRPQDRERLRFTNAHGKLRNRLDRSVPEVAAEAVKTLYARSGVQAPDAFACHTGGRDVLDALEESLPAPDLAASRSVLRNFGNTSSPSVLMVLETLLRDPQPPDSIWLTSFGAGFAAHSCRLEQDSKTVTGVGEVRR